MRYRTFFFFFFLSWSSWIEILFLNFLSFPLPLYGGRVQNSTIYSRFRSGDIFTDDWLVLGYDTISAQNTRKSFRTAPTEPLSNNSILYPILAWIAAHQCWQVPIGLQWSAVLGEELSSIIPFSIAAHELCWARFSVQLWISGLGYLLLPAYSILLTDANTTVGQENTSGSTHLTNSIVRQHPIVRRGQATLQRRSAIHPDMGQTLLSDSCYSLFDNEIYLFFVHRTLYMYVLCTWYSPWVIRIYTPYFTVIWYMYLYTCRFLEAAWGHRARPIRRSGFRFCIRRAR